MNEGLSLAGLALLLEGSVGKGSSAAFGKDDIPKLGDPPYYGKDDAFPNQDTDHISGNLPTVLSWVKELVGVKVLACVCDVS